jgi:hypothetical protein
MADPNEWVILSEAKDRLPDRIHPTDPSLRSGWGDIEISH